jgi:hypothetical protein
MSSAKGDYRRVGAILSRRAYRSSAAVYSPDSNEMAREAEESLVLEAVAMEQVLERQHAGKRLGV